MKRKQTTWRTKDEIRGVFGLSDFLFVAIVAQNIICVTKTEDGQKLYSLDDFQDLRRKGVI